MTPEERAAFRAFVRTHHPDRGGDPEVFMAGLARFGATRTSPASTRTEPGDRDFDGPVELVRPLPFPVRVGVAVIRAWQRRQRRRVQ